MSSLRRKRPLPGSMKQPCRVSPRFFTDTASTVDRKPANTVDRKVAQRQCNWRMQSASSGYQPHCTSLDRTLSSFTQNEHSLTSKQVDGIPRGKQENVVFRKFKSALSSCSENERCYNSRGKSPHVVGHYAAGTRLIGLTEKQMAKRLTALNICGCEKQDSPYAQPLCTFATNVPGKLTGKRGGVGHGRIQLTVVKDGSRPKDETSIEREKKLLKAVLNAKKKSTIQLATPTTERILNCSRRNPLSLPPTSIPLPKVSVKHMQKDPHQLTVEDMQVQKLYQRSAFTDLSIIPSGAMKLKFKDTLETYGFKPTNIPQV